MKIIISGAGTIGSSLIQHLSKENHEVTVIDPKSNVIENVVNSFDVMGVVGNGCSYKDLKKANAGKAHVFLAATDSDETNMLSCALAKKMGAKSTISRIRDYEYSKQIDMMEDALQLAFAINPERTTANEIFKIIAYPEALKVETFSSGRADLIEVLIPEKSPLVGLKITELSSKTGVKFLVSTAIRNGEVIIPSGDFVFEAKDRIYILCDRSSSRSIFTKLGLYEGKIKNVVIIGGGVIALHVAEQLSKARYSVKLVEKNLERCEEINALLKGVEVIHGDGTDQDLLLEEGVDRADAFIALTESDEANIISAMFAAKRNIKAIAKVNNSNYSPLESTLEKISFVSTIEATVSQIVSYVRAYDNSRGSNIQTLYKLVNNQVEALEFVAKEGSHVVNFPLRNLKLRKNILIGGIVKKGHLEIPGGDSMIEIGDNVIVFAKANDLNDLDDILD